MMQIGPALISHLRPAWKGVQMPLIRRMNAEVARIPIAPDFGNPPGVAADLVAAGVTTIVLNTGNPTPQMNLWTVVSTQFHHGGWFAWVEANPGVRVILELANEPDLDQRGSPAVPLAQHYAGLVDVLRNLRPQLAAPKLQWAISAPVTLRYTEQLFGDGLLLELADAVCPHMYGGQHLGDAAAAEHRAVYEWLLRHTDKPLWLTEVGINDARLSRRDAGRRIVSWLAEQPPQVRGACVFSTGDLSGEPSWRGYVVDGEMADALGERLSGVPVVPPVVPPKEEPMGQLTIRVGPHAEGPNRPRLPMAPKWITVHETANIAKGANAEMHRRFVANGGGVEGVSFHYAVDDTEAVEIIPPNEAAWHAGDGYNGIGNRQSIAIETCVNSDGDWERTLANLAALVATLCRQHNIPVDNVVQHNAWSGKNCPARLRANGGAGWRALIGAVRRLLDTADYQGSPKPTDDPNAYQDPETGHWLVNIPEAPMLDYWRANGGVERLGRPLSGMTRRDDGVYEQLLENCLLECWPDGWGPYPGPHVRLGGLGQRYQRLRENAA